MATLTLEIGKKNAKGVRPVAFLVRSGNTRKRIHTEIFVYDSELSSNKKVIKQPKKASMVEDMRRKLQDRLFQMSVELTGMEVDAEYIVNRLTANPSKLDFFDFADEWVKNAKIKGVKNYKCMLNMLERYIGKRELPFEKLNYAMLTGFKDYLDGKPRAQSQYLGYIRHLHKEARLRYNNETEQLIKTDPFVRFKVPRQQMRKGVRALSLEDLLRIYEFKGIPGTRAQQARDCFIMSFCLMGMNSVDLYNLTQLRNNTIKYNRTKTKERRFDGAYIEVKVHPIIKGIIQKYRGASRVFNFCERYADYAQFNRGLNIGLKDVGKKVGIDNLQFYQARHTFATLSRNLMKFSKSDVDEALNHVGSMEIADVYIKKDFSIINENNFKLIDTVFAKKNAETE